MLEMLTGNECGNKHTHVYEPDFLPSISITRKHKMDSYGKSISTNNGKHKISGNSGFDPDTRMLATQIVVSAIWCQLCYVLFNRLSAFRR